MFVVTCWLYKVKNRPNKGGSKPEEIACWKFFSQCQDFWLVNFVFLFN